MSSPHANLRRIRGLDGIRALSVTAVLIYHLGTTGGPQLLPGGFLGVDVFFVLSGFLITSLLLAEAEDDGRISLRAFYVRRAKRLLPALYAVLAGVAIVGVSVLPQQAARLRGDVLAALGYATNWWLIEQNSSYFGGGGDHPPLLNHLWSLAVEEQFYFVWPLLIIAVSVLTRRRAAATRALLIVLTSALVIGSAYLAWRLYDPFEDPSRVYYGTDTRAAAPLLGALLAIAVRPWRFRLVTSRWSVTTTDALGVAALVGLGALVWLVSESSAQLYQGGFLLVAAVAGVFIATVSRPLSALARVLDVRPLRWLGERSYALYLWHWPVFVLVPATVGFGGGPAIAAKVTVTVVLAALSYRYIEQPVRRGVVRRFRLSHGWQRVGLAARITAFVMVAVVATGGAAVRLATVSQAADGPVDAAPAATLGPITPSTGPSPTAFETAAPRVFDAPVNLGVYGDSQGMTLLLNKPAGLDRYLRTTNETIEGCGVLLARVTSRSGERRNLRSNCPNWQSTWADRAKAHRPQVALVMLGAWDVFDLSIDGRKIAFGTAEWDAQFTSALGRGVGELKSAGAQVALALLPCYRPVRASAGFWPERGDDTRTRHVNTLLRAAVTRDPERVFVVEPPGQFCSDPAIRANRAYRWDGVHYYKKGAALYLSAVIPQLLAIPRRPD